MTTVPYKGTAPAMTDLLGGQVDIMCDQTTNTTSQIASGKVKAYAVTTIKPLTHAGPGHAADAGLGRA
jgi:tripartite-type tricarboxylate transporter receptor subunit TctC